MVRVRFGSIALGIWFVGLATAAACDQERSVDPERRSNPLRRGNETSSELSAANGPVPAGLRELRSRHLRLWTDVATSSPGKVDPINELPQIADAAMRPYCAYLGIPLERLRTWRLQGYLMKNAQRFRAAGRMPPNLPAFRFGYQRGREIWVHEQTSDYYRRHLVLHEVVHALMQNFLGGTGPAWYREGMAELLATHRLVGGRVDAPYWPESKDEVPDWGRIRVIREAREKNALKSIRDVMGRPARLFDPIQDYAWSWTLCAFLHGDAERRELLDAMRFRVNEPGPQFNRSLYAALLRVDPNVEEAWQVYLHNLDYGYDVAQGRIRHQPVSTATQSAATIDARAGWQSTGWRLEAGRRYVVRAAGRYRVREADPDWESEPGGITIEYYRSRPLGMLIGAIRPLGLAADEVSPLTQPQDYGLQRVVVPNRSGVLYLRVNEMAGNLNDNAGNISVEISPQPE